MISVHARQLILERGSTAARGFQLGPVDLELGPGVRTALIGPSGSGKTTLLRCLAGLEPKVRGEVHFGDRLVSNGRQLVAPAARRIGYLFQDAALWPHMTAAEHLRFVDPAATSGQILESLDRVGLADRADAKPGSLSGGEAQRLALGRALAGNPAILMLDEPLQSVDLHLRPELSLLIRELAAERGLTLILVTHDREEALAMVDELVILRDGLVVERGPATRLLAEPQTAFGATFLCGAACLPAEAEGSQKVRTAFGVFPCSGAGAESRSLALLPGDVEFGGEGPRGRVLQVLPEAGGMVAAVELGGRVLRVPCGSGTEAPSPGSERALRLRGEPRILTEGAGRNDR